MSYFEHNIYSGMMQQIDIPSSLLCRTNTPKSITGVKIILKKRSRTFDSSSEQLRTNTNPCPYKKCRNYTEDLNNTSPLSTVEPVAINGPISYDDTPVYYFSSDGKCDDYPLWDAFNDFPQF